MDTIKSTIRSVVFLLFALLFAGVILWPAKNPFTLLAQVDLNPSDVDIFTGQIIPAYYGTNYDPSSAYDELTGKCIYVFAYDNWGSDNFPVENLVIKTQIRADGSFQTAGLPRAAHYGIWFPEVESFRMPNSADEIQDVFPYVTEDFRLPAGSASDAGPHTQVSNAKLNGVEFDSNCDAAPDVVFPQPEGTNAIIDDIVTPPKHVFLTSERSVDLENHINVFPLVPKHSISIQVSPFVDRTWVACGSTSPFCGVPPNTACSSPSPASCVDSANVGEYIERAYSQPINIYIQRLADSNHERKVDGPIIRGRVSHTLQYDKDGLPYYSNFFKAYAPPGIYGITVWSGTHAVSYLSYDGQQALNAEFSDFEFARDIVDPTNFSDPYDSTQDWSLWHENDPALMSPQDSRDFVLTERTPQQIAFYASSAINIWGYVLGLGDRLIDPSKIDTGTTTAGRFDPYTIQINSGNSFNGSGWLECGGGGGECDFDFPARIVGRYSITPMLPYGFYHFRSFPNSKVINASISFAEDGVFNQHSLVHKSFYAQKVSEAYGPSKLDLTAVEMGDDTIKGYAYINGTPDSNGAIDYTRLVPAAHAKVLLAYQDATAPVNPYEWRLASYTTRTDQNGWFSISTPELAAIEPGMVPETGGLNQGKCHKASLGTYVDCGSVVALITYSNERPDDNFATLSDLINAYGHIGLIMGVDSVYVNGVGKGRSFCCENSNQPDNNNIDFGRLTFNMQNGSIRTGSDYSGTTTLPNNVADVWFDDLNQKTAFNIKIAAETGETPDAASISTMSVYVTSDSDGAIFDITSGYNFGTGASMNGFVSSTGTYGFEVDPSGSNIDGDLASSQTFALPIPGEFYFNGSYIGGGSGDITYYDLFSSTTVKIGWTSTLKEIPGVSITASTNPGCKGRIDPQCWGRQALIWGVTRLGNVITFTLYTPPPSEFSQIIYMWGFFRNIANGLLIVVMIFIGLITILRREIEGWFPTQLLARVFLYAIFINLSLIPVQLMIDLTNAAAISILQVTLQETIPNLLSSGPSAAATYMTTILVRVGIGAIGAIGSGGGAIVVAVIGPLIMALLSMMTALFLVFMVRLTLIFILTIIAPIAFLSNILPQTQFLFELWWKSLLGFTIMQPAAAVIYAVGFVLLAAPDLSNGFGYNIFQMLMGIMIFYISFRVPLQLASMFGGGELGQMVGQGGEAFQGAIGSVGEYTGQVFSREKAAETASKLQAAGQEEKAGFAKGGAGIGNRFIRRARILGSHFSTGPTGQQVRAEATMSVLKEKQQEFQAKRIAANWVPAMFTEQQEITKQDEYQRIAFRAAHGEGDDAMSSDVLLKGSPDSPMVMKLTNGADVEYAKTSLGIQDANLGDSVYTTVGDMQSRMAETIGWFKTNGEKGGRLGKKGGGMSEADAIGHAQAEQYDRLGDYLETMGASKKEVQFQRSQAKDVRDNGADSLHYRRGGVLPMAVVNATAVTAGFKFAQAKLQALGADPNATEEQKAEARKAVSAAQSERDLNASASRFAKAEILGTVTPAQRIIQSPKLSAIKGADRFARQYAAENAQRDASKTAAAGDVNVGNVAAAVEADVGTVAADVDAQVQMTNQIVQNLGMAAPQIQMRNDIMQRVNQVSPTYLSKVNESVSAGKPMDYALKQQLIRAIQQEGSESKQTIDSMLGPLRAEDTSRTNIENRKIAMNRFAKSHGLISQDDSL